MTYYNVKVEYKKTGRERVDKTLSFIYHKDIYKYIEELDSNFHRITIERIDKH